MKDVIFCFNYVFFFLFGLCNSFVVIYGLSEIQGSSIALFVNLEGKGKQESHVYFVDESYLRLYFFS